MEQIISEKYYDKARSFIQEHIESTILSENNKNQLINLYNSLTNENGKQVYETASNLLSNATGEAYMKFHMACLKISLTWFLIGIVLLLSGFIGTEFCNKYSYCNKFFEYILVGGIGIIMFSIPIVVLFSFGS
ncbi:hypothetical protein QKU48_gp0495 [Fadolivirus algeromassiliense]|jgi:hypothetical protein|uniref:Uncharacterized protein n=1 Tax=Fadolivirus FV1/VV64 TaxID=3070911 RepID=A0A7D3UQN8_9VIRU|nr:hypothetical protein QKU48_gp0495 [Fadolivirus algeromassiliense]QKF93953.1 hypothetical protein Fadolivirus_1_495 [Fadolivirus FV1/VV64]